MTLSCGATTRRRQHVTLTAVKSFTSRFLLAALLILALGGSTACLRGTDKAQRAGVHFPDSFLHTPLCLLAGGPITTITESLHEASAAFQSHARRFCLAETFGFRLATFVTKALSPFPTTFRDFHKTNRTV